MWLFYGWLPVSHKLRCTPSQSHTNQLCLPPAYMSWYTETDNDNFGSFSCAFAFLSAFLHSPLHIRWPWVSCLYCAWFCHTNGCQNRRPCLCNCGHRFKEFQLGPHSGLRFSWLRLGLAWAGCSGQHTERRHEHYNQWDIPLVISTVLYTFLPDRFSSLLCLRIFCYRVVFAQEDSWCGPFGALLLQILRYVLVTWITVNVCVQNSR